MAFTDEDRQNFEKILDEWGFPKDATEVRAWFRGDLTASGSTVSNTSGFSPFWQYVDAILSKFVLLIRTFILEHILPNSFLKTASGIFFDIHLWREGEIRKDASKAVGWIEFTRDGTGGDLPVALGIIIESPQIDGNIYRMITTETVTIPDGTLTFKIKAEAEYEGDKWNLAEGYYSILPTSVPGIVGVSNPADWIITEGAEKESDERARERVHFKKTVAPQKKKYHTSTVYKLIVNEGSLGEVPAEHVYLVNDAPRGPGSANVFFHLDSGLPSAALVQMVDDYIVIKENQGVGDDVRAFAIPGLNTDVTLNITPFDGLDQAAKDQLKIDIEDLIRAIFRENGEWEKFDRVKPYSTLRMSKIISYVDQAFSEVDSVDLISPSADVVSLLELPVLNILSVTLS